eukprot:m.195004 g.195004  ORF g.195004 m.195004 type:complete len:525 (+) comp25029_c0_seq2:2614-4188(+)
MAATTHLESAVLLDLPDELLWRAFVSLDDETVYHVLPRVCARLRDVSWSVQHAQFRLADGLASLRRGSDSAAGMLVGCALRPAIQDPPPAAVALGAPLSADLAGGQENFPVTCNVLIDHAGVKLCGALPNGIDPWVSICSNTLYDLPLKKPEEGAVQVKLTGLNARPELNGALGTTVHTVTGADGACRIKVRLRDGKHVSVRPTSCRARVGSSPILQNMHDVVLQPFRYDAGPWPCRYRLQIFRAGALNTGKGFGVRALERIPKGNGVCTYWGPCTMVPPGIDPDSRAWREHPDNPNRSFGNRFLLTATDTDTNTSVAINPQHTGNVGRWINCSRGAPPNVTPNLVVLLEPSNDPDVPFLAVFHTLRTIEAGDELVWSYRSTCQSSYARSVVYKCGPSFDSHIEVEMARSLHDLHQHAAVWPSTENIFFVEGMSTNADVRRCFGEGDEARHWPQWQETIASWNPLPWNPLPNIGPWIPPRPPWADTAFSDADLPDPGELLQRADWIHINAVYWDPFQILGCGKR